MEARVLLIVVVAQLLVAAAFYLIMPRIARRGLLFGVYVGEATWAGDEARAITRGWYAGMAFAFVASLATGVALAAAFPNTPAGSLFSIFVLVLLYVALYLRAHFQARRLAAPGQPAAAVAALVPDEPRTLALPAVALLTGVAGGVLAIAYSWLHYPDMPARVPTHFGFSGQADQWSARSFFTIMSLPIGALLMGVLLAGVAWLTARAKRAYRAGDRGVSIEAQRRFRRAWTGYLSGVAILTTLMMTSLSIASTRVALGRADALPAVFMVLTGVMLVYALGGALFLALTYGQGGARLERSAADAPLANGLADNSRWVLGAFYVNRDDPSFFVEKRFGIGYTINFGNPVAVTLFAIFIVAILAWSLISALTAS